jgi:hypothetical protein
MQVKKSSYRSRLPCRPKKWINRYKKKIIDAYLRLKIVHEGEEIVVLEFAVAVSSEKMQQQWRIHGLSWKYHLFLISTGIVDEMNVSLTKCCNYESNFLACGCF